MMPTIIQFWLFLVFLILSMICSLFVLYYLLFDRTLRHALYNHVVIILLFICLICEVTIYPWSLYYYDTGKNWQRTLTFCSIWGFIDWGLFITQGILFAWASVERHILIFHVRWISTRKKRFFVHYLPPILLLLYCCIFYSIVYFFPPCQNSVDNSNELCVNECLFDTYEFFIWETIAHQIVPTFIIILFSITLVLRVIWQKHRVHQPIHWRKHRKMTIQLFSIALLYLVFSFPNTVFIFLYLCGLVYVLDSDVRSYAGFFSYFVILFFPFVCLLSLPELQNKIKKILPFRQRARSIGPDILTIRNNINKQAACVLETNVQ